jgi:hypothetical protein
VLVVAIPYNPKPCFFCFVPISSCLRFFFFK